MEINQKSKESIRRHGESIRSITWDCAHKVGDAVADVADRHNLVIVLKISTSSKIMPIKALASKKYCCGFTEGYSSQHPMKHLRGS